MRVRGPSILNASCYFELIPGRRRHSCIHIVFGIHLIAFRFQALVVTEIVLLVVGPVIIAGLGYLLQQSATSATSPARILSRSNLQGYGRFWLALVLGISSQAGLVVGFLKLNPNVRSLVSF
jgi:mannitol-specific phosphotransferase system IIBC component